MKCYDPDSTIDANTLGTFLDCFYSRIEFKNPSSLGYLYYTCKLSKNFNISLLNRRKIFGVKIDNVIEELDKFNYDVVVTSDVEKNESELKLKYYQEDALKALKDGLINDDIIKLMVLPCGTGKTIIFCNHLRERKYKRVFVFSPLRVHAKQTMDRVKPFLLEDEYKYLLVDSDSAGTTDIDEIKNVLNENEKTVLSVTFNSAENVISKLFYDEEVEEEDNEDYEGSDDEDLSEDNVDEDMSEDEENDNETQSTIRKCCYVDLNDSILIIDECHNLINNDNLINIIKQFPNVLLVTATPPSKMEEIMSSELIYEYKFCDAIKDKAICDYRIYLPHIVETDEIPEELKDITEIDDNLYKKGLFLINGLLQKGKLTVK